MQSTDALAPRGRRAWLDRRAAHRRVLEHIRTPLHRDGYALALNSGFTAATGLIYWIVAARSYSTHFLGLNSALISSMLFLAGIGSLNLPNVVVRFLPHSGHRTSRRIIAAYCASSLVALCVTGIFILGASAWAPRLSFLRTNHPLQAWFILSTVAWCVFMIQDAVLTALGRAVWVPAENAFFSLVKLGLLAALAASMPTYGIFVSWTAAMLLSVAGVNVIVFSRLIRGPRLVSGEAKTSMHDRAFAGYFAADYACSVSWLAATNLMPVIVTAAAGATTNAYWALAYALVLPFYAFAQNIGTSLTLHGSTDPLALPILARKAAVQGARLLIPSVAALIVLSPYVLSLFGKSYADNSVTALRLLAFGALPNFVMAIVLSVARVRRRLRWAVIALSSEALLGLGLATPLIHAAGVTGAAIAFVGAQCVVALVVILRTRRWLAAMAVGRPQVDPEGGE